MRLVFLSILLISLQGSLGLAATVDQWTVIGTIGNWHTTKDNAPVVIGMHLTPGDKVEISPTGSATGSLTIIAGNTPKTYACDDPDSLPDKSNAGCAHAIAVPSEAPEPEGPMASLFRQLRQLISTDSPRYYTAASRDNGSLTDSVVQVSNHSVDLRPVLSGLSKGDYRLTVEKLTSAASSQASVGAAPISFHWDPESKQAALGPDLAPGLYHLSAQSSDGDAAGEAWILVVTPANYESKMASFKALQKQTASWNANVPAATVRAVNRAALDEFSR